MDVYEWLLEKDNPAVAYRTRTELLNEEAGCGEAADWVRSFLPGDWRETKGLWYAYYLTALAECGLTYHDIDIGIEKALGLDGGWLFDYGCGDFMRLRALVRLGFYRETRVLELLDGLPDRQLPDGTPAKSYLPKERAVSRANGRPFIPCWRRRKRGGKMIVCVSYPV